MSAKTSNAEFFERACRVLPGGVSSPVRAYRAVGGTPRIIARGEGAEVIDAEGRRYLDFVGSWGPLIGGHAPEEVVEAVCQAARRGSSFGAPCLAEVELAERVVEFYPGIEQVRFVSSGTEATMSAIRLARGATGRDLIVKFSGCYHGHADHLLVAAGSGLVTFGEPASAGVPRAFAELTRVLPLDDLQAVQELFEKEGQSIAAVILEPVPANNGLLVPAPGYLEGLRELTSRHGALLIFDEVITGFRVAPGGVAQRSGVTPDLVTFGKVIGGGLPVGAFAGPRRLMRHLAPDGPVYQAGTLSGNPLAMSAGLAALDLMAASNGWRQLEETGRQLDARLGPALAEAPFPITLVRLGSIFWLALGAESAPRSAEAIPERAADLFRPLFTGLLERGIMIAPSAYEVGFLSLAHRDEHFERLASATAEIFAAWPGTQPG